MIVFSENVQEGYYNPKNHNDYDRGRSSGNRFPRSKGHNNNQSEIDAKYNDYYNPKHIDKGERKNITEERDDECRHDRLFPTGKKISSVGRGSETEDSNEKHGVDDTSLSTFSPSSSNASSLCNNWSKRAHEISDSSDSNSVEDFDNCSGAKILENNDTSKQNFKLGHQVGNSNICGRAAAEGAEYSDVLHELNFKNCIIVELQSADQFGHINDIRNRLEKKDVIEKFCILTKAKKILFQYENSGK